MARESFNKDSHIAALRQYATTILNALDLKQYLPLIDNVIQFQKKIASLQYTGQNVYTDYDVSGDFTVDEASTFFENKETGYQMVDLKQLLSLIPSLPESFPVALVNKYYFSNLTIVVEQTPANVLEAFFYWSLLTEYVEYFPGDVFTKAWDDFQVAIDGSPNTEADRKNFCNSFVSSRFPVLIDYMWAEKYFDGQIDDVVANIQTMSEKVRTISKKLASTVQNETFRQELNARGNTQNVT